MKYQSPSGKLKVNIPGKTAQLRAQLPLFVEKFIEIHEAPVKFVDLL